MRAQQLELIYSQSGMLYEIFPDAPQSTLDKAKQNYGPHADGIVGSTQRKSMDLLSNQLQQLSIQQTVASQTPSSGVPLPRHRMYTVCSRRIPRLTNRPRERRNNEIRRVKGIKRLPTMLAGGK
jgi:hypothetical protein